VHLEVTDNGIGLPKDFDLTSKHGLGVTLLNVLTQQINGEMKVQSNGKTSFKLEFPLPVEEKAEMDPA